MWFFYYYKRCYTNVFTCSLYFLKTFFIFLVDDFSISCYIMNVLKTEAQTINRNDWSYPVRLNFHFFITKPTFLLIILAFTRLSRRGLFFVVLLLFYTYSYIIIQILMIITVIFNCFLLYCGCGLVTHLSFIE